MRKWKRQTRKRLQTPQLKYPNGYKKNKKKQTIVIFDYLSVLYSGKYGRNPFKENYNWERAIMLRFFNFILPVLQIFKPDHIVWAIDDQNSSLRKEQYSAYKEKNYRNLSDMELRLTAAVKEVMNPILEFLEKIGFTNIFGLEGLEADDVMAILAKQYSKDYNVILVTRDNDLLQCIRGNKVVVYDKIVNVVKNKKFFVEKYGLPDPKMWAEVKAIGGCRSDNVRSFPRIAEGTAINYLKGKIKPGTILVQIEHGGHIIKRNRKLVKLPHKSVRKLEIPIDFRQEISLPKFVKMCKKQKLRPLLKNIDAWEKAFNCDK